MPSLVGADGFPAVVLTVPSPVGGVVSLQKLSTVVFPYRWGREEHRICKHHKM